MPERTVKSYKVLVGMEIHVQLATKKSKMFCGPPPTASAASRIPRNSIRRCSGLPGTLPVMNKKAVEYSIKVGLALGCKIAKHTKWDRQSYYYPDLPKNYQISQYDLPLCFEGNFDLILKDGTVRPVRIRRAHLEEDAGKLMHEAPGGHAIAWSIVDLNRAGTPLLEIVTEPDLSTGEDVAAFGQELQKLVQFLGVSHAQMQMGHMRFEPNINVHITDSEGQVHKTAITEIKNLNSFSVLQRATDYEVQRQINDWVETGSLGSKSTYGWDEATQSTWKQRDKEQAHDYRYFPDPDLVPVQVSDAWLTELKSQVGELPAARRKRYAEKLGLNPADAGILAGDRDTGDFFEQALAETKSPKRGGESSPVPRPPTGKRAQPATRQARHRPAPVCRSCRFDRPKSDFRQQRWIDLRSTDRKGFIRPSESRRRTRINPSQRHRRHRRRHRCDDCVESETACRLQIRQAQRPWRLGRHGDEKWQGP